MIRKTGQIMTLKFMLTAAIALAVLPATANAQIGVRGLQGVQGVGRQNFGLSTFRNYSTSTNTIKNPSSSSGSYTNRLKVSDSNSVYRRSGSSSRASAGTSQNRYRNVGRNSSSVGGTNYGSSTFSISTQGKDRMRIDPISTGQLALGTSLEIIFGLSDSMLSAEGETSTFTPDNQGQYATIMRNGEQAMKVQQYQKALDTFKQSSLLNTKIADSYLAMAHANFALGRYSTMAHNLSQAINTNKNIFSANIALRSFFAQNNEFIKYRDLLTLHCQQLPRDTTAQLALSYVLWFDNDRQNARKAILRAKESNSEPLLSGTITAIIDSMDRSEGKIVVSASATDEKAQKPKYSGGALLGMVITASDN